MATRYLKESSAFYGYKLEDGSGVLLLEENPSPAEPTKIRVKTKGFILLKRRRSPRNVADEIERERERLLNR
jgi:hypothetical protein